MSLIKFRGAIYREVVAVQMGKLVDSAEFNSALKTLEKETKYLATQWEPAEQLFQKLKQFVAGIAPKAEAVLTKAQGHAFNKNISRLLTQWHKEFEASAQQLKKINSAASSGVVSYDNLVAELDKSQSKNQGQVNSMKLFKDDTEKVLGLLTRYVELVYNFEDAGDENKTKWYFDFVKQFPGHDVLAPIRKLSEAYTRLQASMEQMLSLFSVAHHNLLGKAKKNKPEKVTKKKHTDKQTEFESKEEASPSAADIAASQDEVANPKLAKAQGLIKTAVDELLEPAKTEYDVLYNFFKKEAPKIVERLEPFLDRYENDAFGEQTIGEIAFGEEFTPEHEKQFQAVAKATKFIAAQFKRIIAKFFTKTDADAFMFPGPAARLKKLKPDGKYLSNLQALAQRYDAAEKVLAQDALADALA